MRYPEYPVHGDLMPPVKGLLGLFARMENGTSPSDVQLPWSQRLGEMCVMHSLRDKARLSVGLREFKQSDRLPDKYKPLVDILRLGSNRKEVMRAQHRLHAANIKELSRTLRGRERRREDEFTGTVSELVALGLLSRYAHPWALAMPTLPHHDGNKKPTKNHFDLALALTEGDEEQGHYLQVKYSCTGRCCGTQKANLARSYSSKIQLVSGCCDLGLGNQNGQIDLTVPNLLVLEFNEQIAPEGVKQLDVLSDGLLFNISADLMPRGLAA